MANDWDRVDRCEDAQFELDIRRTLAYRESNLHTNRLVKKMMQRKLVTKQPNWNNSKFIFLCNKNALKFVTILLHLYFFYK
jgi:hypothetical protein